MNHPTTAAEVEELTRGMYQAEQAEESAQMFLRGHNAVAAMVEFYSQVLGAAHAREHRLKGEVRRLRVEIARLLQPKPEPEKVKK